MNTADILEKAALILERDGWCRGRFEKRPGGPVCAVGAIRRAASGDALCHVPGVGAVNVFATFLVKDAAYRWGLGLVQCWNDDQRDKRKVVRALRRAARSWRAGHPEVA